MFEVVPVDGVWEEKWLVETDGDRTSVSAYVPCRIDRLSRFPQELLRNKELPRNHKLTTQALTQFECVGVCSYPVVVGVDFV